MPQQTKRGLSAGALVAIVALVLLIVVGLGVGGYFGLRMVLGAKKPPAASSTPAPAPAAEPAPSAEPSPTPFEEPATPESTAGTEDEAPANDEIVTDVEARAVVKEFMAYKKAKNASAAKTLCSKAMLKSDMGWVVTDKYWYPFSYKIVKTTPDLMYIHVAIMGDWPSGKEPSIFSVWRDPASGKVVIDGMIDPANMPELYR